MGREGIGEVGRGKRNGGKGNKVVWRGNGDGEGRRERGRQGKGVRGREGVSGAQGKA